ncbi:MAG TPA: GspE/PulE family protein [Terriglobales bacterium]|nr:GspE/PulE family protein [Terriglobales bacterium]
MELTNNLRLGEILMGLKYITKPELDLALAQQEKTNRKLGAVLLDLGFVTAEQLINALDEQYHSYVVNLEQIYIPPEVPLLIPEKLARRHVIIPIKLEGDTITLAMQNPANIFAVDDVKLATGLQVKTVGATPEQIQKAINIYYEKSSAEKAVEEFNKSYQEDAIADLDETLKANVDSAPVVKLLNSLIRQAVQLAASDIHIEPLEKNLRIRFRIDGELREMMQIDNNSHSAIVTRIKIIGNMDIAEKRVPQDGRVEMTVDGRVIDMRLSVMPTVYGEKIVIRLLDRNATVISKHDLGFSKDNMALLEQIIQTPHGIILVTGPTGSGKTTTLYTILRELNVIGRNIITIEDPVEYRLSGVNQSQVNVKAGYTFASGLRSILRQDPDIIMIGEIRDAETAEIAVRAAITGHLVLSTIHTNDAVSTISRLMDMGIEPYMVSSSIVGVIAQRLVRKICPNCRESYHPSSGEKQTLGAPDDDILLYRGKGCAACGNSGYKGRTSIHEILPMREEIKEAIDTNMPMVDIKKLAQTLGMTTLRDSCRELVLGGVTTMDELLRITFSID